MTKRAPLLLKPERILQAADDLRLYDALDRLVVELDLPKTDISITGSRWGGQAIVIKDRALARAILTQACILVAERIELRGVEPPVATVPTRAREAAE